MWHRLENKPGIERPVVLAHAHHWRVLLAGSDRARHCPLEGKVLLAKRSRLIVDCRVAELLGAGPLVRLGRSPAFRSVHWIERAVVPTRRAMAATATPALNAAITASSDGTRIRSGCWRCSSFARSSRRWGDANMDCEFIWAPRKMVGI
jgi:hypothetical protein